MLGLTALALLACDPDPEWSEDANLCGSFEGNPDTGCDALPETVEIWTTLEGKEPCADDGSWWDTGSGADYEWKDELIATAAVDASTGAFEATLEPGDYAAWVSESCYACTPFTIDGQGCTQVSLDLKPMVYLDAPNVYLYPTETTRTQVRIPHPQAISAVDPEYPTGGWQVTATPSGLIHTPEGPKDYLFYELALPSGVLSEESGWCVPGPLAQASIEDAMADYGFLAPEIEDFAEFWDPVFPDAAWMTVRPKVEGLPALQIDPVPEELLRVWFIVEPGCQPVVEPEIHRSPRTGYHAAEWGVLIERGLTRQTWVL